VYKAIGKEHLNGKFTADRAPVTYILATNQMKAGQMVMFGQLCALSILLWIFALHFLD
jgi:hypothetical protein